MTYIAQNGGGAKGAEVRTGKKGTVGTGGGWGEGKGKAEHKVQIYATAFAAGIKKLNQLVLNCAKIKFFPRQIA